MGLSAPPKFQLGEANSCSAKGMGVGGGEALEEKFEPFLLPWPAVLQELGTRWGDESELRPAHLEGERDHVLGPWSRISPE